MQDLRLSIRKEIRQKRNHISSLDQTIAANDALSKIKQLPRLQEAENIAIYLTVDGELDTHPTIEYFWQKGKNVYLPVLHPFAKGHLLFLRYDVDTPMIENKFNIKEPKLDQTKLIPISQLDIIFTPLVAFDVTGNRLGMGGGYYDRTLEQWFKTGRGATPIGIAHDCQQVDKLPNENWDVPLPIIITPSKVWRWSRSTLGN
ncbi:5-formyltetrahydrofolate cyclo-ligase [Vibrio sp. DW001]|uniref:5-formyltetrahydrofolate cyclo-ligase n=1 Tax=Vibrio sp. DW001 TaxID=2912315 RepID=UPI0023B19987|nr:5-formyltetrahydrofolate cyclo-ligase [Vibrio sp. DW001]WED27069.1 5-formyltetrahydrofolate cyclo-ligase [Vibrio sp. DW001]